eukprot:Em0019g641a
MMHSAGIILLCCLSFATTALGSDFVSQLEAAIAEGQRRGYDVGVTSLAVDPVGIPFTCTPYTTTPAQSVHQLTPADVKVIGAIGDSITAAMGAKAGSILTALTEYRGVSWSIGGDGDVSNTGTLANVVKKYNSGVKGFSTGTGSETNSNSRLNVAVSGAVSSELLAQAYTLINKIKADTSININTDWKVITLWIGGNDLCDYCSDTNFYSASNYAKNIEAVLDVLKANLPRTYVNLVEILDVTQLAPLSSLWCDLVHTFVCDCATTGSAVDKQMTSAASKAYNTALENLISSGKYDTSDDFTVVIQPFPSGIELPYKNGEPDKSYFAPDCFHFSTKGHKEMAVGLWNNMLQPVGQKSTDWTLNQAIICPSANTPYFYTKKNSPAQKFGVSYASEEDGQSGSPNLLPVYLGVGVGTGVLALVVVVLVVGVVIRKRRQRKEGERIPLVYKKSIDM